MDTKCHEAIRYQKALAKYNRISSGRACPICGRKVTVNYYVAHTYCSISCRETARRNEHNKHATKTVSTASSNSDQERTQ